MWVIDRLFLFASRVKRKAVNAGRGDSKERATDVNHRLGSFVTLDGVLLLTAVGAETPPRP